MRSQPSVTLTRTALLSLALLTSGVNAEIRTETIEYDVDGTSHTGYLAYDDSVATPRPGVLVVHEWWGLSDYERRRARMLAELGYAAFAVDMYGTGKLTDQPDQAREWMSSVVSDVDWWRSTALEGVELLKARAEVDPDRIAAIGYCFGGGTVLQLAYGADIAGVVSFHGSLPAAEEGVEFDTKILVAHGHADPFIPKQTVERFQESLEKAGADWQMLSFGGQVHGFTNPAADQRGMAALRYDADTDRRSWAAMKLFLKEVLGQ